MIGRLRGMLAEENSDGSIVLDVDGVGYEVFLPLGTLGRLPNPGPMTVHVHTHVREDAITLFGFASIADRTAFRTLLGVSGVGPKLALAILGALDAEQLAIAIERGDKNAFKGISGVGKKTVEHLLVDLKGKLALPTSPLVPRAQAARPATLPGQAEIVVGLLVNMGYRRPEAERAIQSLGDEALADKPVETLLREALRALG